MSSHNFAGLFDIHSVSKSVTNPPPALKKSYPPTPSAIELEAFGSQHNGPGVPQDGGQSSTQKPNTEIQASTMQMPPNDLESSTAPFAQENEAASLVQTWSNPPMNRWRVLACCLIYFGNGVNDSATGPIIPYMEKHYNIGYAIVALIFVGNAVGFILAAFFTDAILERLGRAKTLMLAELLIIGGYIMLLVTPPFGVIIASYFLLGYGMALNLAMNNVFCANLHPSTVILGAAHGSYGIGGIIGPIMATALLSQGKPWPLFFVIPLSMRVLCIFFSGWAFWSYEEDSPAPLLATSSLPPSQRDALEPVKPTKLQLLKQAVQNRVTLFGALFIFAYQGAEVSISGWVISFLISYRNGDPAHVGYVTAGFWAGITLGRFVLTHAAPRIGERPFVVGLIAGSMAFQLLVWLVPSVISNAVAVAILGLLLGPIYPCAQVIFSKTLPRNLQTMVIGFIASAGSSGGAVAPFTTGLLAQAVGTYVLHPVCIGLYVAMLVLWLFFPMARKRTE